MEVFVEKQPECLATLRATIPSEAVKTKLEKLAGEFRKSAKLPGFRPGKAPVAIVARKYKNAIAEELTGEFVREMVSKAEQDNNFKVINAFNLEHGEVGERDLEMTVQITLEPEFNLPDVETLNIEVEEEPVTEEMMEQNIYGLLERFAEFSDVKDRPAQMKDYVVITYTATVDGHSLAEVYPEAPSPVKGGEKMWMLMEERSLWPGFSAKIVGMNEGEERTVEIVVPEDFVIEELRGKTVVNQVKLEGIKAKKLPELTDEIVQQLLGKNIEDIRKIVREKLEDFTAENTENKKRSAVVEHLVRNIEFEVPKEYVVRETRRALSEIVESEQVRGISQDDLVSHKDEIFKQAQLSGQFRTRADFILLQIARERKLEATQEDIVQRLMELSARTGITLEKIVKRLSKNDGLALISHEIIRGKALDFLASKVKVKRLEKKV